MSGKIDIFEKGKSDYYLRQLNNVSKQAAIFRRMLSILAIKAGGEIEIPFSKTNDICQKAEVMDLEIETKTETIIIRTKEKQPPNVQPQQPIESGNEGAD